MNWMIGFGWFVSGFRVKKIGMGRVNWLARTRSRWKPQFKLQSSKTTWYLKLRISFNSMKRFNLQDAAEPCLSKSNLQLTPPTPSSSFLLLLFQPQVRPRPSQMPSRQQQQRRQPSREPLVKRLERSELQSLSIVQPPWDFLVLQSTQESPFLMLLVWMHTRLSYSH